MKTRSRREKVAAVVILVISLWAAWFFRRTFPDPPVQSGEGPRVSVGTTTLIVHMTGLLLIVPPKQAGGATDVLMVEPDMGETHEARFVFEGRPEKADLCKLYDGKDCYVDMYEWSLEPIGADGTLSSLPIRGLPNGVLNLTAGSGNRHRVRVDTLEDRVISTFLTGRAAGSPCSLGLWYYDPPGWLNAGPTPVANRLDWEIRLPGKTLELVFRRRKSPFDTAHVMLVASSDTMHVLVSHRRPGETRDPPDVGSRPRHFDALYDPLEVPEAHKDRTQPRFLLSLRSSTCPAKVETKLLAIPGEKVWALDTYGCLLAAAERK